MLQCKALPNPRLLAPECFVTGRQDDSNERTALILHEDELFDLAEAS